MLLKPIKNCFLLPAPPPICTKGSLWALPKIKKKKKIGRNNESRSSAYILTELLIFLYLQRCFFVKKGSFLAKTADNIGPILAQILPLCTVASAGNDQKTSHKLEKDS